MKNSGVAAVDRERVIDRFTEQITLSECSTPPRTAIAMTQIRARLNLGTPTLGAKAESSGKSKERMLKAHGTFS